MLQELYVFLGIYFISFGLSKFLFSDRAGVFKPFAARLFFIGVIFHEFAHYGMCLAVGRIPKNIKVKWRHEEDKSERSPHGSVGHKDVPSFLQSLIISLAPLYLSTWLMFGLWFGVIFTPLYDALVKILAVFLLISLLLTAAPSSGDLQMIGLSFRKDPKHSWYQIFLIALSALALWIFLVMTQNIFILDVFYYFAIAGFYLLFKFSFIGLRKVVIRIDSYNYTRPDKVRFRSLTRKRYKPRKSRANNE